MNCLLNPLQLHRQVTVFCFLILFSQGLFAQLPSGFIDTKIQGAYTTPMGVAFSKNGLRMFVWEKKGVLWVSNWNGISYVKQTTPALDISEEVGNWRDFGLQSVALDPNYDTNGLIYLFYQVDRHHLLKFGTPQYSATTDEYFDATISRLTRYKLNNAATLTADLTSRKILLGETKSTGVVLTHDSHGGGQIVFGTDGTLIVSTGDNANYNGMDFGSAAGTYFQQAITDGMMRATENVGAFRSQMINSFCGKLLRLDPVTGDGLSSNPYYDAVNPRSAKSRVWALGLRNPYRISFKTGTGTTNPADGNPGTVIVCDVQWFTWEEMHIVEKAGINCGWPIFEGITNATDYYTQSTITRNQEEIGSPTFQSLCQQATSLTVNANPAQRRFTHFPPALDWNHDLTNTRYPEFSTGSLVAKTIGSAGAHITGTPFIGNAATAGTYYSGTVFPAAYQNVYFFADYGANWIKAAALHDNSTHQIHEVKPFAPEGHGKGIVDVEYCPLDQSIFYVNINTGDIQRISFGSGNQPPVAVISANKTSGPSPLVVNFSSSGSNDPDGGSITYNWNFGDGSANATSANPSHTFTATGSQGFTVTLTVKDNAGLTDSKTLAISVNNTPPSVKITNPVNNAKYILTQATNYTLQSTVTDNDVTAMQYAWQVTLRHDNHEHREPVINQQSPTVVISPVGCDGDTYYYLIEVTVTDRGGLTAKDSVKIFPDCTTATLAVKNLTATPLISSVRLNWTNPTVAFDEVMVVAQANTRFLTNPSGTAYTANADFTGNGTAFEGGKVVYKGIGMTATVTNLVNGIQYYFRVFTRKGTAWTGGVETSATPLEAFDAAKCYKLTARVSSKVMEVPNGSVALGTKLAQKTYTSGARNQIWKMVNNNEGSYQIVNVNSGLVADVSGNLTTPGATVGQWNWNTGTNQRWIFTLNTEGYYKVVAQHSNLALEVPNGSLVDGTLLQQNTPNGSTSQQWKVEEVGCAVADFDPTKCYKVTARVSSKAMEVPNGALTNGVKLAQQTYTGAKHQLWKMTNNGDGTYRMVNLNSDKVADVSGYNINPAAPVAQWDWNTGTNQRWTFDLNTEGYYKILAKHSNLALEVTNGSLADGALLQQNTPNGSTSQQWKVEEAGCAVVDFDPAKCYKLTARVSNKAIEVPNGGLTNGIKLTQQTYTGAKHQLWKMTNNGDGTYRIVNSNSNKVVDVSGENIAPAAPVAQWDWNTGNNQRWTFNLNTEGYYKITAKHSNLALEVPNGSLLDGALLQQNTPNGSTSQQWKVEEAGCAVVDFDPAKCYKMTARVSNKVMEVPNGSVVLGTNLAQKTYVVGTKHQLWKFVNNLDGTYQMVNANSGLVADVAENLITPGAAVGQWNWNTGTNQRWIFTLNTEGYSQIVAKHSALALEVPNGSLLDGAQLQQNTPTGSTSQQWKVEAVGCPAGVAALAKAHIFSANGHREGKKGIITWFSNTKQDKDYFVVEKRKADEPAFETLAIINAQYGDIGENQFYTFTDEQPMAGQNFYRVALYRAGELVPQYSEVITLDFTHLNDFLLFPNPANDFIDIDLERVRYKAVKLTLTDVSGQLLKEQKIDAAPIAPVRMSLEGMPNGSYFIGIEAKGRRKVVKPFVIIK